MTNKYKLLEYLNKAAVKYVKYNTDHDNGSFYYRAIHRDLMAAHEVAVAHDIPVVALIEAAMECITYIRMYSIRGEVGRGKWIQLNILIENAVEKSELWFDDPKLRRANALGLYMDVDDIVNDAAPVKIAELPGFKKLVEQESPHTQMNAEEQAKYNHLMGLSTPKQ